MTTLAGGHVMIGGGHPSEVMPHIKAGRFKPLAVALPERDASLPNVPTLKEQGINVYTWGSIKGVAAPAATPKDVVEYLATTLKKVCEDAEFKKIMTDLDQPIMYQNSAAFTQFLQQAYGDYGKLIKDLNIPSSNVYYRTDLIRSSHVSVLPAVYFTATGRTSMDACSL